MLAQRGRHWPHIQTQFFLYLPSSTANRRQWMSGGTILAQYGIHWPHIQTQLI